MLTAEQIVAEYEATKGEDFLGFAREVLIPYLPYSLAKPYLKPEVKEEEWVPLPISQEAILNGMREYMAFAWEKALNHRGISAGRSVDKMRAWLTVLENTQLLAGIEYQNYGAPILIKICEYYGFPIPSDSAARRMAQGLPCCEECDEGCG